MLGALTAGPAAATINPPGNCEGTGDFTPGPFIDAAQLQPFPEIPLKASVSWVGAVNGVTPPPEGREISGVVAVDFPFPVPNITAGDWFDEDATGTSSRGTYTYDLPSILAGYDIVVVGSHSESGSVWCSGSVTLHFEGTSPLLYGAIVLTVVSIVGVGVAMRARQL